MYLGNGICDLSGLKKNSLSNFFEHFNRYFGHGVWRQTVPTYNNSVVKSRLKSKILVVAVNKKMLLNQDFNCSEWPSSLCIGPTSSSMVPMSLR